MTKFTLDMKNNSPMTIEANTFLTDPHFIIFKKKTGQSRTGAFMDYPVYEDVAAVCSHLVISVRKVDDGT